jgi:8-amino-3,8-dideoxy-alpha-D-manno-octulosonate transaminase
MPGFELIGKEEQQALNDIFETSGGVLFAHGFDVKRNGRFRVREFEKNFSNWHGDGFSAACTSGTAAQYIAMKCMGIGPGDEVITQAFTFVATVEAILACGAIPIVVNVNETYNIDPLEVESAITTKTKAIVPVHMLGNPAEMEEINAIAKKHNLFVIEDSCEALGATYKGQHTGLISDVGVFSLDFGKTITCGEGGMIISKNQELISNCFQFIDHGHECRTDVPRGLDTAKNYGFNFRMTEMQGAVGLAQLEKLRIIVDTNRRNKKIIKDILKKSDKIEFRKITDEEGELSDTIIFNFPKKEFAEKMVQLLSENGLGTKNIPDANNWHFAKNWSQMWKNDSNYKDTFENQWAKTDELLSRSISLPIMVSWDTDFCQQYAEKILNIIESVR